MSEEQRNFLLSIGINPDDSEDVIEEKVGDYLVLNCLDDEYNPTPAGIMCESILDYISSN